MGHSLDAIRRRKPLVLIDVDLTDHRRPSDFLSKLAEQRCDLLAG